MFKIPRVENPQKIIDRIFDSMQAYALKERDKITQRFEKSVGTAKKDPKTVILDKRKDLELLKIRYLNSHVNERLKKIIKSFPQFRKVDDIYIKLINTSENNVKKTSDALARLLWIINTIDELTQNTEFKIKKARTHDVVKFTMKKYLGRVNSYFRKNKEFFKILEESRYFMNNLPEFLDLYSVGISGFPNVGKSTLMKNMTGSDVEIQNYPFTTKGLMFGYLDVNEKKSIQLIDTPGLLGRDKNNGIEERAQIVITSYVQKVIFVIDFTETCGYDVSSQIKLLKKVQNYSDNILIYLSKSDLYNEETDELLKENESKFKKFKVFKEAKELKSHLIWEYTKSLSKFDPKNIKTIKSNK